MKKSELKQLIKEQISMMGIVGLQAIGSPFMSHQEVVKEDVDDIKDLPNAGNQSLDKVARLWLKKTLNCYRISDVSVAKQDSGTRISFTCESIDLGIKERQNAKIVDIMMVDPGVFEITTRIDLFNFDYSTIQ